MDPNDYPDTYTNPVVQSSPLQSRQNSEAQLRQAVSTSHEVLVTATSVFPFILFPDTISVDRTKITIAKRSFFKVAEVLSMNIEDVLSVTANVGPLFGSLKIVSRFFDKEKQPYEIKYLRRDDTLRVKRILQGYVIAVQKQIDCSVFGKDELVQMLDHLGGSSIR